MIRFVFFLFVLILAVWLGVQVQSDPGYILISYGKWIIEMSLWLSVIILILLFFAFHWLLQICHISTSVSGRVRLWSNKRRLRTSQYRTSQGLIDLSEGNWRRAEKNLVKAANDGDAPLINFLAAAKAAQEQDAYERRDNYLRKAHHINPEAKIAVELTQAQLQIHHKQFEQALATLRHLRELSPNHCYVLKLLKTVCIELKDWKNLIELMPEFRRLQIDDQVSLDRIETIAYENLLKEAVVKDPDAVAMLWDKLPKSLKHQTVFIVYYCDYLLKNNHNEAAEKLIRESIKKELDKDLIRFYSIIPDVDHKKQLIAAENWLKLNKSDPDLLLCLGKLCKLNQLWGKAKNFIESSIILKPSKEAYTELGQLFEQLNEPTMAMDCYRKALEPIQSLLVQDRKPVL